MRRNLNQKFSNITALQWVLSFGLGQGQLRYEQIFELLAPAAD